MALVKGWPRSGIGWVTYNLFNWLVPDTLFSDPEKRRRALVFAAVCLIIFGVGNLRALAFLSAGLYSASVIFLCLALTGLGYLVALRRGWRFDLLVNLFGLQIMTAVTVTATYRGGIGASVLGVLAIVPLMMTFCLGIRVGVAWWFLGICLVMFFGIAEGTGLLILQDHLAGEGHIVDTVSSLIIPTSGILLAAAFELSRIQAAEATELALIRRAEAERDVVMTKADKMASIGLLAAGVGHEVNNPLTFVGGNVDFVLSALEDDDFDKGELVEALRDANDGVQRIARITTELGTFARTDHTSKVETVRIEDVVSSAVGLTRHELEYRSTLKLELEPVPSVLAFESKLVQIVVNLLLNAAHAVEVRSGGLIVVRSGADDGRSWLEVSDNGKGIPVADQERIFDPFFTTKALGSGTGLGLSTSRSLARAVGGTLNVESVEHQGSTFRLSIPNTVNQIVPPRTTSVQRMSVRQRILVVDDEAMFERTVKRILRPHEVVLCESVEDAIKHLLQDSNFDLVMSDVMMYPVPGWEFLTS